MRVAVVTSDVPFIEGGHRVIARSLVRALRESGHTADLVTTPQNRFGRQISAYWATWLTDVGVGGDGSAIDRVISLRFPSYAVRHPHQVVWLNHRMREYYDLWDDFRRTLGRRGRIVEGARRRILHVLDGWLLRRRTVIAQSKTIQARLTRWGDIPSQVLYPPAPQRAYRCDAYNGSILVVGRLTGLKRVDLLLQAAAAAGGDWRVRIAGEGPQRANLVKLTRELGLDHRVVLLGELDEDRLVHEYAHCAAVYFGSRAEDYGLVTLEAFSSAKAVVTCTDSGGPAELVEDGVTGFVAEPEAEAVAAALTRLVSEPRLAEKLGTAAAAVAERHSWPAAVETLLSAH
ncbi:MAG TPA: glycosyltransferase family 4 protein [Acidobacteriota bacterium]